MIRVPSPEERFSKNAIHFCEFVKDLASDLHDKGHNEVDPEIIGMVGNFLKVMDSKELIRNFITHSKKYWKQIEQREETFINEHAMEIFYGLPENHISSFQKVFYMHDDRGEPLLTAEDKKLIWKYFDSFVTISKKYEELHSGDKA